LGAGAGEGRGGRGSARRNSIGISIELTASLIREVVESITVLSEVWTSRASTCDVRRNRPKKIRSVGPEIVYVCKRGYAPRL
jgi:hypothetical protein